MTNIVETIKASDIPENDLKEAFFLDIREPNKAPSGSILSTKNIPMNELRDRINEIPKDKKVYITFQKRIEYLYFCPNLGRFGYQSDFD